MSGDRSLEQWLLIKRGLYYRKYSQGYTSVKDEAQMYSHVEALKRCMAIIEDASLAHPGDHETVYAIPDRLAPAYLHGGFPDVIAKHASTTVASLTAERDAAIAKAEAAEAQVAKLKEALGRFAATSERVNAAMMQPPDDDHDFTPDRGRTIVGLLKELLVEMGQHARATLEPAHD